MSTKHTAEYWREWRKSHREQYLANQRRRRANMSPKKRAKLLAAKKEWHRKHDPNYGVGRGHGRHYLLDMTAEERKAHHAAQCAQWRMDHADRVREKNREWYLRNIDLVREYGKKWIETHYQRYLEVRRRKNRKANDKTRKVPYRAKPSMRVPEWVTCPAQKRHLEAVGANCRMTAEKSFRYAISCGLTVGRFSA